MRYNKKGKFNIPYGRYKTCNFEDLKNKDYETLLKNTDILNESFETVFDKYNDENNFVFLDPPYELTKASNVFRRLKELRVTKINSLIIYECNKQLEKMDGLAILRSKKIGKTYLNFFKGFNE